MLGGRIPHNRSHPQMLDQRGMDSYSLSHSPFESQNATVIDLYKATTLPLLPFLSQACVYLPQIRETLNIIYNFYRFPLVPLATPRGFGKAISRLLCCVVIFTILVELILYVMLGATSHLASQAHAVARNTRSITLAVCALPVPFKSVFCAEINNELFAPLNPNVDHSQPWHPYLINESIHGPAIDFAIHKAANLTSVVLALVCASDLTQRHGLSDKLKDFLRHAWASELSSGTHLALVKTVIDE